MRKKIRTFLLFGLSIIMGGAFGVTIYWLRHTDTFTLSQLIHRQVTAIAQSAAISTPTASPTATPESTSSLIKDANTGVQFRLAKGYVIIEDTDATSPKYIQVRTWNVVKHASNNVYQPTNVSIYLIVPVDGVTTAASDSAIRAFKRTIVGPQVVSGQTIATPSPSSATVATTSVKQFYNQTGSIDTLAELKTSSGTVLILQKNTYGMASIMEDADAETLMRSLKTLGSPDTGESPSPKNSASTTLLQSPLL
jgi:hypothetical protein